MLLNLMEFTGTAIHYLSVSLSDNHLSQVAWKLLKADGGGICPGSAFSTGLKKYVE